MRRADREAGVAKRAGPGTISRMTADLRLIIDDIARRADDFLDGSPDRAHARAGVEEVITMDYPALNPADRAKVVAGVMAVLAEEDFFGIEFVGDPFADDSEDEE